MNHGPIMFRSIESIQLVTDLRRASVAAWTWFRCELSSWRTSATYRHIPTMIAQKTTQHDSTTSTHSRPEMLKPFERQECPGWLSHNNILFVCTHTHIYIYGGWSKFLYLQTAILREYKTVAGSHVGTLMPWQLKPLHGPLDRLPYIYLFICIYYYYITSGQGKK